jgi:hypothetical protein
MFRSFIVLSTFFLAFFLCFTGAETESTRDRGAPAILPAQENLKVQGNSHAPNIAKELLLEGGNNLKEIWNRCIDILGKLGKDEEYSRLKALIEQHPGIVHFVNNGRNLLMEAIPRGNEGSVVVLVPYFANSGRLDDQDFDGNSALFIAIQKENECIVALLLIYGARIDIRNAEKLNPLHVSCSLEDSKMFYFMEGVLYELDKREKSMAENKSSLTRAVHD